MPLHPDEHSYKEICDALDAWAKDGRITPEKKQELLDTVAVPKTQRQQIAQYFFIVAVCCGLLAFAAIFINDKLLETLKKYFALSNIFIAAGAGILSAVWFYYVRRKRSTVTAMSYETYMMLGALTSVTSLVYFCKDLDPAHQYTILLLLVTVLHIVLGLALHSVAIWVTALLALCGWYSVMTSQYGAHGLFLGMNYPVRFTLLGLVMLGAALLVRSVRGASFVYRSTYLLGLLVLLTALWGVSVFGNYADLDAWHGVRQSQVLVYGVLFALVAGAVFYLGIRQKDSTTRDLGIIFLLLNLYTRYFEFFWDNTNKGIFFLLLAVSFWLLGRWLNKRKTVTK